MSTSSLAPHIASRIVTLREQRVMLDADLALLYGVETRVLVQAFKRNAARFPENFMFQLTAGEFTALRSQLATSSGHGGRRTAPYAFTEQRMAMLSSVLCSPRAVAVNIDIMRTFVKVRALAATHQEIGRRFAELQEKTERLPMEQDTFSRDMREQLRQVFEALRELMTPADPPKRAIGFVQHEEKRKPSSRARKR